MDRPADTSENFSNELVLPLRDTYNTERVSRFRSFR